jgi:curved DNA-binding protein CbpA
VGSALVSDDPYAVLGVGDRATAEEVRQAYFRLVRVYSPEAHPEDFKRIRAAYEALRSPLRRAELALMAFDESAGDVDLDVVARVGEGVVDLGAVWLAVELSASDLTRAEFPDDLTPIREEDLLSE